MRRAAVVALLCLLAAGCFGAEAPTQTPVQQGEAVHPLDVVPAAAIQAGGSYLLQHTGHDLRMAATGQATLALVGPDGTNAGHFVVGAGDGGETDIPAAAGTYVVHVEHLVGNVTFWSDTSAITSLRAVETYQVRTVVAQSHSAPVPANPLAPNPMTASASMRLPMAPLGLHVLVSGPHSRLHVVVATESGPVVTADSSQGSPLDTGVLRDLPANSTWDNLRGAQLTLTAQAADFDGTLVVAADVPSPAVAVWPSGIITSADPQQDRFTYGEIPRDPASVSVAPAATRLVLVPGNASGVVHVSLFTPTDSKLADVAVGAKPIVVPITAPGTYVVLADGPVHLAADAVPSDFAFHALRTSSWLVEGNLPPQGYGQDAGPVAASGVAYQVLVGPPAGAVGVPLPCSQSGTVSLLQHGEPVFFIDGSRAPPDANATLRATARLDGSSLEYKAEGPGLCPTPSIELRTYLRPSP